LIGIEGKEALEHLGGEYIESLWWGVNSFYTPNEH